MELESRFTPDKLAHYELCRLIPEVVTKQSNNDLSQLCEILPSRWAHLPVDELLDKETGQDEADTTSRQAGGDSPAVTVTSKYFNHACSLMMLIRSYKDGHGTVLQKFMKLYNSTIHSSHIPESDESMHSGYDFN